MEFQQLAQEMVEATAQLLDGRTINIMDTNGVILASSEKYRIGTVHFGAIEVIKTGNIVYITEENLHKYEGAKIGCNLPIYSDEHKLIGVVGIFGSPEEVKDAANLLALYTTQYFAQRDNERQKHIRNEIRSSLVNLMISKSADTQAIQGLSEALKIKFRFPAYIFVVNKIHNQNIATSFTYNDVITALLNANILNAKNDLWSVAVNKLVIIKSNIPSKESEFFNNIKSIFETNLVEYNICVGSLCENISGIRTSYKEASLLSIIKSEPFNYIGDVQNIFDYFIYDTVVENNTNISVFYDKLISKMSKDDLEILLHSAKCYYDNDKSVTVAAEILHVHKNTLQYRLRRIWEILELENSSSFVKEYLCRLCIVHHKFM